MRCFVWGGFKKPPHRFLESLNEMTLGVFFSKSPHKKLLQDGVPREIACMRKKLM